MSYPDLIGHRLNYDVDGTRVYKYIYGGSEPDSAPVLLTEATKHTWLNEDMDHYTPFSGDGYITWFFPEPMVLTGYHVSCTDAGDLPSRWETSANTTDGLDGTWVDRGGITMSTGTAIAHGVRLEVHTFPNITTSVLRWSADRSVYFGLGYIRAVHLYGQPANLGSLRRLVVWDDTADVRMDPNGLNWGDPRQGTITYRTFRVKNLSATETATQVVLTYNDLTTGGPLSAAVDFSDGGAYAFSLNIGDLAPGAISSVITARLTLPADAPCGPWSARLAAIPTDWT